LGHIVQGRDFLDLDKRLDEVPFPDALEIGYAYATFIPRLNVLHVFLETAQGTNDAAVDQHIVPEQADVGVECSSDNP